MKIKFIRHFIYLSASSAALFLFALSAYVFADSSSEETLVNALQGIADYSTPGVGVDKKTYLPYDHIRIDEETGLLLGCGTYSAATKVAPYSVFLLKCYQGNGRYGRIALSPIAEETEYLRREYSVEANNKTVAMLRLKRMFESVRKCIDADMRGAPYLGGMLSWISINRDGNVTRDKDLVPLLDNGILSWAYAALLGGLEDEAGTLVREVCLQVKDLLERQNYDLFIDHTHKLFFGEIDVTSGRGNPGYMLKRIWTEDVLSILWGFFTTSISEEEKIEIWNNSLCPIAEWEMTNGEKIDVPKGYVTSNHEIIWSLLYLPLAETALKELFNNTQYLQADFALRKGVPGFQSVAYNPVGSYMKMGIPDVSEFPGYVQECINAIAFATSAGLFVDQERGSEWLSSLIEDQELMTRYGPLESVGLPGRADILSADSQYLIASAIGGGVQKEVERYLKESKVKGSDTSYYDLMRKFFDIAYKRILGENSIASIRSSSRPFPSPKRVSYRRDDYKLPSQETEFELIDNLAESGDDHHGSNVCSVTKKNGRWEIDSEGMLVKYNIPLDLDKYYRFAWWGTYLGKRRPYLAAYTDISVTVPNDDSEQKIMMHLKREDCSLTKPISINTRLKGAVSADGKWKTYTFGLKHRKRFIRYPLTYIAFSVDDPKKNLAFNQNDSIRIKSLRLFNRDIKEGLIDVNKSIIDLQKAPFAGCRVRPSPCSGKRPYFLDSGAIGEATENISREENGLLYFEFEDVNTDYGSSGIWTLFKDMELGDTKYFVFDISKGEMEKEPSCLRLEFKRQEQNGERVVFLCSLELKKDFFYESKWCRIVIPLPHRLRNEKINMINFVYDSRSDKVPSGSILISSPVFVEKMPHS